MADGAIRNSSVRPSDRRSVGPSVIWKEEKLIGPSDRRSVGPSEVRQMVTLKN